MPGADRRGNMYQSSAFSCIHVNVHMDTIVMSSKNDLEDTFANPPFSSIIKSVLRSGARAGWFSGIIK